MPDEPRLFEPLMYSIEQVLTALDNEPLRQSLSQSLQTAATDLRGMFEDFDECCCRKAHVIPFTEARMQAKPGKKAMPAMKAKAGKKVKAGKKAKSVSARSKRR
jgi:hypothetical protein